MSLSLLYITTALQLLHTYAGGHIHESLWVRGQSSCPDSGPGVAEAEKRDEQFSLHTEVSAGNPFSSFIFSSVMSVCWWKDSQEGELSSQNYNGQFIIFLLSDKDIQHLTLFSCLHLICMLTSAEWPDSRSSVWVCSARSDGLKHLQLFWGILGAQIQPRLLYLLIICFMCSQLIF